jgi:dethiobiotin synthetase
VLVADAGLGTINVVRLTTEALRAVEVPQVVVLNRFDASVDLHVRNRSWLRSLDLGPVVTIPDDGAELASLVAG